MKFAIRHEASVFTVECYTIVVAHNIIFVRVCKNKKNTFLNILQKSWESLVTLQLPSDYGVVNLTNESEKKLLLLVVQTYQKKETGSIFGNVT